MTIEQSAGPDPKSFVDRMWAIVGQRRGAGQSLDEVIDDLSGQFEAGDVFLAWHAAGMLAKDDSAE